MPKTGVSPCFRVKLTEMIVNGFIISLKTTVIALLIVTPFAAFTGMVELTVGGVVSDVVPIMGTAQADTSIMASISMIDIKRESIDFLFICNLLLKPYC